MGIYYEGVIQQMMRRVSSAEKPEARPEALSNVIEILSRMMSELFEENLELRERLETGIRSDMEQANRVIQQEFEIKRLKNEFKKEASKSRSKLKAKKELRDD